MWADMTFAQMRYLKERCGEMFGLEPMAIIFSLPWALLMWSYVISSFRTLVSPVFTQLLLPAPTGW